MRQLLLHAVVLFALAVAPLASAADDLVLVADEWCPYNCAPDSDRPGYMVEIAREAFAAQGITVRYEVVNWARAVIEARDGRYDGIIGAFHGDAPDFVFPSESLGVSGNAFFIRRDDDWRYAGPDSLRQRRVGIIRGYDYGGLTGPLQTYAILDIVGGDHALEINIRKLLLGRIDTFVEDVSVARYQMEQMQIQTAIRMLPGSLRYVDVFIAFSPAKSASADRARHLSDMIGRMRADGRLQRIMAVYGLEDWEAVREGAAGPKTN